MSRKLSVATLFANGAKPVENISSDKLGFKKSIANPVISSVPPKPFKSSNAGPSVVTKEAYSTAFS